MRFFTAVTASPSLASGSNYNFFPGIAVTGRQQRSLDTEEHVVRSISACLKQEGVFLTDNQARLCARHILLMQSWNQRVNLTRITGLREILIKHLLDSLLPSRWLPRRGSALDVGTGAGFPRVPINIVHPGLTMTLLETKRKKVSFLKVLLTKLQVPNLRVIQGKWEGLIESQTRTTSARYDLITLRALRLNPDQLAQLAGSLLNNAGAVAWWVGPKADESIARYYNPHLKQFGIEFEGCFPYALPSLPNARNVCIWRKLS